MSEKNALKINNEIENPNFYILSSWNYGSFSPTNPYYKTHLNFYSSRLSKTNPNLSAGKTTAHCTILHSTIKNKQSSKTKKIVTNELLENYIFEKNMKKHSSIGTFNPKNLNKILNPKKVKEYKTIKNNNKLRKIKTDIGEFKYKLNFSEWLNIKNKQIEYFNIIIKKNEKEEKMKDEENKKIEIKYNQIKEQKYKEWCNKKNIENILKKELKRQLENYKEKERKKKLDRREEIMSSWFKIQAKKMEKELIKKRKQKKKEKEKQNLKEKEILEKKIKGKEAFQKWMEEKDKDRIKKKKEEKLKKEKEEEQKKKDFLKKKVKSFIIGPYTGAGDLRKALNSIIETNLSLG